MDAAPEVTYNETLIPAQFDKHSQEVDAYWKNTKRDRRAEAAAAVRLVEEMNSVITNAVHTKDLLRVR